MPVMMGLLLEFELNPVLAAVAIARLPIVDRPL
jgi:hypothetical protein